MTMEQTNDKEFLRTEPLGKLLLKLALPTVAAQLINMLYNIVDRIYIGHIPEIGAAALTGVGVAKLLDVMADTKTPQGVLFLGRQNSTPLPEHPEGCRYLILDGVQDPGNVGTIWRTADAFCADGLILCNGCADPWSPKTVRSTMGAAFRLPVYEETLESAAGKLAGAGIPLYATALGLVCSDVRQADFSRCAVVIGSEGRGISQQALELCSVRLRIPMSSRCESLNAASAATVVLWEMNRDRL